jgi:membrane associated rhomboid family serine protease
VSQPPPDQGQPTCVRHPDRPTGLRCVRCERPACPECLREASVGYQCVDCVNAGRMQPARRPVTIAGAELGSRLVVVPILIAINVAVFVLTAYQAQSVADNQLSQLFFDGVLAPPLVAAGEWWRLITSGFLHIGLPHLLLNMVSLWIIGRELELVFGKARFLVLYMLSMLGGSAAVYIISLNGAAGASGAIYGLMGALAVTVVRLKLPLGQVLAVIVLNLALSFSGLFAISWEAHIGGLIVGALAAVGFLYPPARLRNQVQTATVVGLVVLLTALMIGVGNLGLVDAG